MLNQDQARDATIALYSIRNKVIPPLGSPSSAGPFNFGPWYDWIIMVFTVISFGWQMGPWVGFTILSVTTVLAYILVGKRIGGKSLGIIMGLVTATGVGLVENAPDMLNTVIVGWSTGWVWYCLVRLTEDKKIRWAVPLGFLVGLSINFHFQSWGLMTLLLTTFLINHFDGRRKILAGVAMGGGWLTAFLPLIVFDIQRKGQWINSVIYYYTVGVKKFYVPVRWLTELRDFWPRLFGSVTTGIPEIGYVIGLIIILGLFLGWKSKKKISKTLIVTIVSLLMQVILMRFYKGVRSREYLIVFHGYIVILASYGLWKIWEKWKVVGTIILIFVLMTATVKDIDVLKEKSQARIVEEMNKAIEGKMDIYQVGQSNMISLPIFYLKYSKNLIGDNGQKIGICDESKVVCPKTGKLVTENEYYKIFDLNEVEIVKDGYERLTPELIYGWLFVNYGKK